MLKEFSLGQSLTFYYFKNEFINVAVAGDETVKKGTMVFKKIGTTTRFHTFGLMFCVHFRF